MGLQSLQRWELFEIMPFEMVLTSYKRSFVNESAANAWRLTVHSSCAWDQSNNRQPETAFKYPDFGRDAECFKVARVLAQQVEKATWALGDYLNVRVHACGVSTTSWQCVKWVCSASACTRYDAKAIFFLLFIYYFLSFLQLLMSKCSFSKF